MAKMAKLPQTDWTRGGHEISQTAIPLYKENLNRMGDYLADPMAYQQQYLDRYYDADNIRNQDFLKAYQRTMGNTTANNWAATTGGFTSAGNRSYNDRQKYWNDLASRLADYGITSSYNMANQDFQNMRGANSDYYNAYQLGKAYSDVEQQNALARQSNRNWIGNALQLGGAAIGGIVGGPVGAQVGGALGGAVGSGFQTDTSQAMAAIYGGNPQNYYTSGTGQFINPYQAINDVDWGMFGKKVSNWWNKTTGPKSAQAGQNVGLTF